MTLFEWITLMIAIWGAGLSTFLAIRGMRKDVPRVSVQCEPGVTTGSGNIPRGIEIITVTAINTGHRPLEIISTGFDTNDTGISFQQLMTPLALTHLPKVINDGESVSVMFSRKKLESVIENLRINKPGFYITGVFVEDVKKKKYTLRPPQFLRDKKLAK